MFLDYYKLAEQPFGVTPDSRFLYLGPKHREALASLVYGTESNRGFLALIAKPGMGKTSLLYHYLAYLRDKARTAFVFRTDCDPREFIRHLLLDLGIDVAGMDLPAMHDTLNRLLTEEMRAGRRFVLVIDEAQNLDERVLESIRLLSNFETPWTKLMQIVLAGQPQLADRLASPSMAQLRQRISMVIRIEPLTNEEVNAYIDHRLWIAGCEKPAFLTVGARKLIADHSEGIPRNINNLCFNAMSLACALQRKTIDRDIVRDVIADLDLEPLREKNIAAAKPEKKSVRVPPVLLSAAKKQSASGGWIPKLAITSALLLAAGALFVNLNRGATRSSALPDAVAIVSAASPSAVAQPSAPASALPSAPASELAPGPAPVVVSEVSLMPAQEASATVKQATEDVRVQSGQTLYQISVNKFGKYDGKVLEELRGLNPSLDNPNLIRTGQKIRIPSTAALSTGGGHAAEQAANPAPTEAGKQ
ncbi:MAG: AAA family ATPase [Candidatus Acidiferrales bacterium]